jgi:hypothetical protein
MRKFSIIRDTKRGEGYGYKIRPNKKKLEYTKVIKSKTKENISNKA